jgi:hypothetical protein
VINFINEDNKPYLYSSFVVMYLRRGSVTRLV